MAAKASRAKASRVAPAALERPSSVGRTYRGTMRAVLEATITAERWRAIVECAAAQAEEGDRHARAFLAPWVVGRVPDEVKVQQSGNVVIEVVYGQGPALGDRSAPRGFPAPGSARTGGTRRAGGE